MSNEVDQHCWDRRCALIYKVRLSILYHLKHSRFLSGLDKTISILTAASATAAVSSVMKASGEPVDMWASAITAVLSIIPLVFNPSEAAKKHTELAFQFRKLLAEFERAGLHWRVDQCDEFTAKLVEQEATEPASLSALVAHCQNELNLASDGPQVNLNWFQSLMKHLIPFDAGKLDKQ